MIAGTSAHLNQITELGFETETLQRSFQFARIIYY